MNPHIPCAHIAEYYHQRWLGHKCIAFKLLWQGYWQCATGNQDYPFNNLYGGP